MNEAMVQIREALASATAEEFVLGIVEVLRTLPTVKVGEFSTVGRDPYFTAFVASERLDSDSNDWDVAVATQQAEADLLFAVIEALGFRDGGDAPVHEEDGRTLSPILQDVYFHIQGSVVPLSKEQWDEVVGL